jgi:hypothetical protein
VNGDPAQFADADGVISIVRLDHATGAARQRAPWLLEARAGTHPTHVRAIELDELQAHRMRIGTGLLAAPRQKRSPCRASDPSLVRSMSASDVR